MSQVQQPPQIQQAQQGWGGGTGSHGQAQTIAPSREAQTMGSQPGMGRQGPGQHGPQLQQVSVEDVVQTDVVTAESDTPLPTITEKMESEAVGSVVIVDDDEPVGIVTDRSIALCLHEMDDLAECTVDDVAVDDLVTGTTEMSLFDALEQMSTGGIRRLPVVDDDGGLAGIVTLDDVLVSLGSEMEKATDVIRAQSPRL